MTPPPERHLRLRTSCVEVAPSWWIGGDLAALPTGVRTVVSLDAASGRVTRAGVVEHRHPFRDTRFERVPRGVLDAAVAAVLTAPAAVLVRCRHGINRSALVVCLALIQAAGLDPPAAIARVRHARPGALTNPYFEDLVLRFPQDPLR